MERGVLHSSGKTLPLGNRVRRTKYRKSVQIVRGGGSLINLYGREACSHLSARPTVPAEMVLGSPAEPPLVPQTDPMACSWAQHSPCTILLPGKAAKRAGSCPQKARPCTLSAPGTVGWQRPCSAGGRQRWPKSRFGRMGRGRHLML